MNNNITIRYFSSIRRKRGFPFIKLIMTLLLLNVFTLSAKTIYSQEARLTINMKNASIQEVMNEISSQSEFTFAWSSKFVDLTKKVDIQVKNSTIDRVLNALFNDSGIQFKITGKTIVLTPSRKNTVRVQPKKNTVHGTVKSRDGETLPGVNVYIKGTSTGTTSDINGKYSIPVNKNSVLVFSYIGMQTTEIKVGSQQTINVVMKPAATGLNEVVVVGYGIQKESSVTSAISVVKAENFNKGEINNPLGLLQGKVAGLAISRVGSNPNGGYAIRIRGLSTLGANSQPLIVIDGVPPGVSLNDIDPTDIASVSVLKGASAAAIYGTRGSSGVIIVTTKSGHTSHKAFSQIEYSGSVTMSTVAKEIKVLTPEQYKNWSGVFKPTNLGSATNWFKQIMHTGVDIVHNLAISGGGGLIQPIGLRLITDGYKVS
ncbi:MAG: TonB-dependent receptor plug domain-containing protein [Chlorobi bacterium]|nr:TonB-dependent receptor plug domain-containing protein [Chlorobiota bacterium]